MPSVELISMSLFFPKIKMWTSHSQGKTLLKMIFHSPMSPPTTFTFSAQRCHEEFCQISCQDLANHSYTPKK